ncbi:MAG: hypothetical protein COV46_03770 [Deltaproteobacteria bacterium CG11_big_fil_rev_8_21_14_0_20_49_13]|nr:MAG: hypothetical protein COV46_03770 [Deltaproteobacteria bacterium CG11_big_fil_rev_8_21_14_0_20_49_13]
MKAQTAKIVCFVLVVLSVWFSFSFRGGNVFLKVGTWERLMHRSQAVMQVVPLAVVAEETGSSGDSGETDFG